MRKESIAALPDEFLRRPSKRVRLITDKIRQLVADMEKATLDWEDSREHEIGVALAAIQIKKPLRVIIVRNNFEDRTNRSFRALINPEIIKYEGELEEDFEGCLSVRDIYGKVPRHNKIKVKAYDLEGRAVRFSAEGFLARVLQHEIDHTHGKLFIDYIKDNSPDSLYRLDNSGQLIRLTGSEAARQKLVLRA